MVDGPELALVSHFCGILNCQGSRQHILPSTHKNGHMLHLVVLRAGEGIINYMHILDHRISDHQVIQFELQSPRGQ